MRIYEAAYLRCLRELCDCYDCYDCLLICDEIATGFGCTGKMFACEHAEIAPDIICVGKALSGGYLSLSVPNCIAEITGTISDNQPPPLVAGNLHGQSAVMQSRLRKRGSAKNRSMAATGRQH